MQKMTSALLGQTMSQVAGSVFDARHADRCQGLLRFGGEWLAGPGIQAGAHCFDAQPVK